MQENEAAYPEVTDMLIGLMRGAFGTYFSNYYEGDPLEIPKSNLPCVIVEKIATRVTQAATGTDRLESQLSIRVVLDKSDDYNADDNKDLTDRKLRKLVESRHPETGNYHDQTVLGVLRKNITVGNALLEMNTDVDYFIQDRSEDVRTAEAVISIITVERVLVGSRG